MNLYRVELNGKFICNEWAKSSTEAIRYVQFKLNMRNTTGWKATQIRPGS